MPTFFASQVQTLPFLSGLSNGVQYPPGSLPHEQHLAMGLIKPNALASLPVYPVQLYEGALLFIALLMLWRFPRRQFEKGVFTILVVCAYAFIRFFIEYLRADGPVVPGNLTVTQLQCLFLLVSAVLLLRLLRAAKRQRAA
jgi:prolipoprotein diacylglyceryltransferase